MSQVADWQPSQDDLDALDKLSPPNPEDWDVAGKDITYPYCRTWSTGRKCKVENTYEGVIEEERCVNADGSVTKTYTCVPA